LSFNYKEKSIQNTSTAAHLIHPKYRPDIDGLRAIAVILVVGFHAFPNLFPGGFIGVDIFFVISGFLISSIIFKGIEQGQFSFFEFYGRRIRRIFPALVAVLLATFCAGWFLLLPDEFAQLGTQIAGGAGFVSNFVLWHESGYFDAAAATKPLLHLWSLGIEEQFYLVWPCLIWLGYKARLNLLAAMILIVVISFGLNLVGVIHHQDFTFYWPQTRFWELLAGAILANLKPRERPEISKTAGAINSALSVAGLIAIAAGVVLIKATDHFPGSWALLPVLGAVCVITAGATAWANKWILASKPLVWIGLISYPIYLWHWPLLVFARISGSAALSSSIGTITIVVLSVALAWTTYLVLEKPIRLGARKEAMALALIAAMAIAGCTGYATQLNNGFPSREPKIIRDISSPIQVEKRAIDVYQSWRRGTCFLDPWQTYADFDKCKTAPEDTNKPAILLWGDSYAAHLYPGYKSRFSHDYNIVQRTTSSCPPIMGMEMTNVLQCKEINEQILSSIKEKKYDTVVLSANWDEADWPRIVDTIKQIQAIGISKIDVIGFFPQWNNGLPRNIYLKYKSTGTIPNRMRVGLNLSDFEADKKLAALVKPLNVNFISPMQILCNDQGCITMTGATSDTLVSLDYGHLTVDGSGYLVSHFPRP